MNDRASRPAASSAIGKPRKAFGQSQSSRRSRTEENSRMATVKPMPPVMP